MKIAFVNARYAPNEFGGAEKTVRTMAEALVQNGHQVCAISLSHGKGPAEGDVNGVKTYYLPPANLFTRWKNKGSLAGRALWHLVDAYNPVMGRRVGAIFDRERPDLVHTSNLVGFSVAVWRAAHERRIPIVQELHDYYLGCPNSSMFRNGKNCARQCHACRVYTLPRRTLSNLPTAVISLSGRTLEKLHGCGLFANVADKAVIHGISNVSASEAPPLRARQRQGGLVVGYLGRMEPTKGIEVLLDSVQKTKAFGVRVLLGGSGTPAYLTQLKSKYESENIEFCGYVTPKEFFERIDLLAVPSLWEEPLGRVIYEAYAHGRPVIVHRIGGMPEIVADEKTGFVVAPGDSGELERLLTRLAANWDAASYFQACIEKSKEFGTDQRYPELLEVWQRAASSGSLGRARAAS